MYLFIFLFGWQWFNIASFASEKDQVIGSEGRFTDSL